jgi:hypothetical protein
VYLPVCQFLGLLAHADHFYVEIPSQTCQNDDTGRLLDGGGDTKKELFNEELKPGETADYE